MSEIDDTYKRLAAPFDVTFHDVRGGVNLEYLTGEQVVSRLNEVLGPDCWSLEVLEHGIHQEADECWSLVRLTARFPTFTVVRQQFGSQKVKRSRATGTPLDIGFDLKGATTDAMKKCATLIGVGLYLSKKDEARGERHDQDSAEKPSGPPKCAQCGGELKETKFKDGTIWTPAQLAQYGLRKHGEVLCMADYRKAGAASAATVGA